MEFDEDTAKIIVVFIVVTAALLPTLWFVAAVFGWGGFG